MKRSISVRAVLAAMVLTISLPVSEVFAADEVKAAAAKSATIDSSRLSPELTNLAKLVQSGVDEKVVLAYVQNSPAQQNPTADELIYLHELGLSSQTMVALLVSAKKPATASQSAREQIQPAPAPVVAPARVASSMPAPASTQSVSSSPTVIYTPPQPATVYVEPAPLVTYVPSWPYPVFSFGLDFGHLGFGHFGGGHHGGHFSYGHNFGGGHGGGGHH